MGYQIPATSPTTQINGRTIAVAAYLWNGPFGAFYQAGVFEMKTDGWNLISPMVYNTEDLIGLMKQKGGSVAFLNWLIAELNKMLVTIFGVAPPVGEPTTNEEADAYLVDAFSKLKLTVVNGIPVLA